MLQVAEEKIIESLAAMTVGETRDRFHLHHDRGIHETINEVVFSKAVDGCRNPHFRIHFQAALEPAPNQFLSVDSFVEKTPEFIVNVERNSSNTIIDFMKRLLVNRVNGN